MSGPGARKAAGIAMLHIDLSDPFDPGNGVPEEGQHANASWQGACYSELRAHGVRYFCYVPDAGHATLIEAARADPDAVAVGLSAEEEGVAIIAGLHLGDEQGVLLMQSSGVGNCVNFLSLIKHGRFPFLALVTMRGEFGEQNPWQYPMGQATEAVLQAMGVITLRVDAAAAAAPTVAAACDMAASGGQAVAVLLGQRLIGAKAF
jgi:sulfopyruvate decarboxylase alpha subunit